MLWLPGFRKRLLSNHGKLGRWGENYCEKFLKKQGFMFVARNFKCKYGEIDLIFVNPCPTPPEIVFIEVKTRRREGRFRAQDAVLKKQRRRIGHAAKYFIRKYQIKDKQPRFDIIAVFLADKGPPKTQYYKNAFVP